MYIGTHMSILIKHLRSDWMKEMSEWLWKNCDSLKWSDFEMAVWKMKSHIWWIEIHFSFEII